MDKYYYFVAQLPMLFYGREAGMTINGFLDEAKKWLSSKDYNTLSQLNLGTMTSEIMGNSVVKQYTSFEASLRKEIVSWRKARLRDLDYKPESIPASVLKEGNPLDVEVKLLQLKWDLMDQIEREHHFDIGFVILYYLKLQILDRLFTFNKEEGLEKFQKLYEENI
jgi:hypothetical protein